MNCTNVVECVDQEKTRRDEFATVILEAFDQTKVPKAASVFKDPSTAEIRVYANDAAKEELERWASDAGVSGIEVVPVEPR